MLPFTGFLIVIIAVVAGFKLERGNLYILFQPPEIIVVLGAAIGGFIVASPSRVISSVKRGIVKVFRSGKYTKADYLECLALLGELFLLIKLHGIVRLEGDLARPEKSALLQKYPNMLRNRYVISFICDTFKMISVSNISAFDIEQLLDIELEVRHEDAIVPSKSVGHVAEALPGLGIIAAVLGVIVTMGKMNEPPNIIGESIGMALVGTLMGVLLCYGFMSPLSRHLEHIADIEREFLNVVKVSIVAFSSGMLPQVAIEFGRRVIPEDLRPSFEDLESSFGTIKKTAGY